MAYNLKKLFSNTAGIDLRSSDLLRQEGAASGGVNFSYRQTGAITKRKGYQTLLSDNTTGGQGTVTYFNKDIITGEVEEELLTCSDNLHKFSEHLTTIRTMTLQYTGTTSAHYNLYVTDESSFKFDLYENNFLINSWDLGSGYAAADMDVSTLRNNINATSGFVVGSYGAGTEPAAFLPITEGVPITITPITLTDVVFEDINIPIGGEVPFKEHETFKDDPSFENNTFTQMNGVLYIANGNDPLQKYDGNRVYSAGLPRGGEMTNLGYVAPGGLSAGAYQWKYIYTYTDAKGNMIESRPSEILEYTATAGDSIYITYRNVNDSSRYNTDEAIINGNQTSTNDITVLTGHGIKTGDTVYINDTITGEIVSRVVIGFTYTRIIFSGDPVTVVDTEKISCIKITILRTAADGILNYIHSEYINEKLITSAMIVIDTTADTSLTINFQEHVTNHDPPPAGKYIASWRNQLIITGKKDALNTVYYSDIESPEYFPAFENNFIITSNNGGNNTGVKALDNTLFVFTEKAIFGITGELTGALNFQVDAVSDSGMGCASHNSLKEINGRLWMLGTSTIHSIGPEGIKIESNPIEPLLSTRKPFTRKRAVAFYDIESNIYILSLPDVTLDVTSGEYSLDDSSIVVAYDVFREAWLKWDKYNMLGGITLYKDNIYMFGRQLNSSTSNTEIRLSKIHDNNDKNDYNDHNLPVNFSYYSTWHTLGEPSVPKKFLRLKVFSLDTSINDFETNLFNLSLKTQHDYNKTDISDTELDFSGNSKGWGLWEWGNTPWSDEGLPEVSTKLASRKAKALRVVLLNDRNNENILVSGYEMEIATQYALAIKD